jgi:putative addiction module component (TIGR02574 family)
MTRAARNLLTQALSLPEQDRADLAAEILASLDGPADVDWNEAWAAELDRRIKAANDRGTPLPEWSAVRARILDRISRR